MKLELNVKLEGKIKWRLVTIVIIATLLILNGEIEKGITLLLGAFANSGQ